MTQTQLSVSVGAHTVRPASPTLELPCRIGQWEVVALAAEGSLAKIYRARAADLPAEQPAEQPTGQPAAYALKMLRRQWQDDARAIALLAREAQVGRSVSHPHLISVLAASVRRSPRFLVMPWLEGRTLKDEMAARRQIDLPAGLWIARQVAEALDALHQAGWMHGDVKPSNFLISPEGHLTLLDLGFARGRGESGSAVDRCVLGTCAYIAPELITSTLRADIRSDIYSLGVVLFELFSGRLPFIGDDLAELAGQHKQAAPPSLYRLAPHLTIDVVRLIRQMLAKDPLRRPQTPCELIDRLAVLEISTFSERAW